MIRLFTLVVLVFLTTLMTPLLVTAQTDQGFEWGFADDDQIHFMMHLNGTGLQIDEEIYIVSNDTLPNIQDSMDNWTDIPYTDVEAYYANGTQLGIEILTFVAMYNVYLPIGNWSLLSTLALTTHGVENLTLDPEDPFFWGYTWEDDDWVLTDGGVTIYSNYTIYVHVEYLKTDGFLAHYSVDAYNATTKADAGKVVLERLGLEKYRDTTEPTITNDPRDIVFVEGQVGNTITWYASDDYPGTYKIIRTFLLEQTAPWTFRSGFWNHSSEAITVVVDGFTAGEYYFSLYVYDVRGNKASNRVRVTVLAESEAILFWIRIFGVGGVIIVIGAILIRRELNWRRSSL